jgi:hypothetical protein
MSVRSWCLAALLAGGVLAAPAGAQDEFLDYQSVREAMPRMRDISTRGSEFGVKLHKVMDALDATQDVADQRKLREELRVLLTEYRMVKLEMEGVVRPLLKLPQSGLTDQQVLDKLRTTELHGVVWEDAFFDKCIRDLSGALGIPIRLQHRVVQKNTVAMRFQKVPAEMILATLCNGFDLRYVIHSGEIVVYKKITPTEERFLDYQKRHPEVKLKYWQKEDASGNVDTKGGDK